MARFAACERDLTRAVLDGFAARAERITLYGGPVTRDRLPVFAFNVNGERPGAIASALDAERIEARAGDFYAPRLLRALAGDFGNSAVRLSFAHYNTLDDVERCFAALDRVTSVAHAS